MSEPETQSNSLGSMMSGLAAAARSNQDEAIRVWQRGCELYAGYFTTLAKAKGPDGLLAANADLMTGTMAALAKGAAVLKGVNGAATKP